MCQSKKEFIFCTCTTDQVLSGNTYTWILKRLTGMRTDDIMGSIVGPSDDLGDGITITISEILVRLNKDSAFDFAYVPEENDTLTISTKTADGFRTYLSVIYKSREWVKGSNPAFVSITQNIKKGYLDI